MAISKIAADKILLAGRVANDRRVAKIVILWQLFFLWWADRCLRNPGLPLKSAAHFQRSGIAAYSDRCLTVKLPFVVGSWEDLGSNQVVGRRIWRLARWPEAEFVPRDGKSGTVHKSWFP